MKRLVVILCLCLSLPSLGYAQSLQLVSSTKRDAFTPIAKYLEAGDYNKLSAWFDDNLEFDILGNATSCSRNQGCLIMKNFFNNYSPKSFTMLHRSGRSPMLYAVGTLSAGGEKFRVIIYVKTIGNKNAIQQLTIEKE